jgi:antitoxin YefM
MSKNKNGKRGALPEEGVDETEHLLRSPKNVERLLRAMERARVGDGEPQTLESLRQELGLDSAG